MVDCKAVLADRLQVRERAKNVEPGARLSKCSDNGSEDAMTTFYAEEMALTARSDCIASRRLSLHARKLFQPYERGWYAPAYGK